VERYLGLTTIGVIPITDSLQKRDYHREEKSSVVKRMRNKK